MTDKVAGPDGSELSEGLGRAEIEADAAAFRWLAENCFVDVRVPAGNGWTLSDRTIRMRAADLRNLVERAKWFAAANAKQAA